MKNIYIAQRDNYYWIKEFNSVFNFRNDDQFIKMFSKSSLSFKLILIRE